MPLQLRLMAKLPNRLRPSVKFTALDEPTRTNIPVKINKNGDIGTIDL
jgi:hypothetical protein